MSQSERYRLIEELTATGGTIRDISRRWPNYSKRQIEQRLEKNTTMAKVITVSRHFMSDHPKAGKPTYFVNKIWKALGNDFFKPHKNIIDSLIDVNRTLPVSNEQILDFEFSSRIFDHELWDGMQPKLHTIRSGKRFKTGDIVSLRVWSGKPYKTPQIAIAPEFALPRVADIVIKNWHTYIDGVYFGLLFQFTKKNEALWANDGLTFPDFRDWFKLPCHFDGQIIFFTGENTPY